MEREVGGGIGMGNTCKPLAVSFQCMTKSTTNKKKKKKIQTIETHNHLNKLPGKEFWRVKKAYFKWFHTVYFHLHIIEMTKLLRWRIG